MRNQILIILVFVLATLNTYLIVERTEAQESKDIWVGCEY
jgi:hypothetical protein